MTLTVKPEEASPGDSVTIQVSGSSRVKQKIEVEIDNGQGETDSVTIQLASLKREGIQRRCLHLLGAMDRAHGGRSVGVPGMGTIAG